MPRSLIKAGLALALGCLLPAAMLATPAAAAKTDWPTHGFDAARTGANPTETTLSVDNVGGLTAQWTRLVDGGAITGQPIVATGIPTAKGTKDLIIVGTETGTLTAVDARTGKSIWTHNTGFTQPGCGDLPDGKFGITSSAAFSRADNRVYAMGGDGKLYAYAVSDGEPVTGWPVAILPDPSTEHVYGGLNLANGGVYVVTASMCDQNTYHGRVVFVDPSGKRPKITHAFYTDGTTTRGGKVISYGSGGGGIWGPGGVTVDADGSVYVATGNLLNSASEHDHYGDQVVKLDASLDVLDSNYPGLPDPEADVDFGSTAVLFQAAGSCPASFAAINKDQLFFTYDRSNLAKGPLQQFSDNSYVGDVAFDAPNNQLLVTNLDSVQAWRYDAGCNATLAWSTPSTSGPGGELGQSISPPTTANGVVYYGNGAGRMLEAFNARNGRRLLKLKLSGSIFAAPTVVNGHVYVVDWAGNLTAFAPAS